MLPCRRIVSEIRIVLRSSAPEVLLLRLFVSYSVESCARTFCVSKTHRSPRGLRGWWRGVCVTDLGDSLGNFATWAARADLGSSRGYRRVTRKCVYMTGCLVFVKACDVWVRGARGWWGGAYVTFDTLRSIFYALFIAYARQGKLYVYIIFSFSNIHAQVFFAFLRYFKIRTFSSFHICYPCITLDFYKILDTLKRIMFYVKFVFLILAYYSMS